MVHLIHCLNNLLLFDIPVLYHYTNLNSSMICSLCWGDIYLPFCTSIWLLASSFCECNSVECNSFEYFLKQLLVYLQCYYQLNHQLLLQFSELLFLKQFYCTCCRLFISTMKKFLLYLLLKFLFMFFTKNKNPYPFTYILSLNSVDYLNFIIAVLFSY